MPVGVDHMASNVVSSNWRIFPYRSAKGSARIMPFPQGSTVSSLVFRAGDPVQFDTRAATNAYRVVFARPSATDHLQLVVGVAAEESAAGDSVGTKRPIYIADVDTEFVAYSKSSLVSTHIGSTYALYLDSTLNIWYVELNETASTSACVEITELVDDLGDSNGRVAFKFIPAARDIA